MKMKSSIESSERTLGIDIDEKELEISVSLDDIRILEETILQQVQGIHVRIYIANCIIVVGLKIINHRS